MDTSPQTVFKNALDFIAKTNWNGAINACINHLRKQEGLSIKEKILVEGCIAAIDELKK